MSIVNLSKPIVNNTTFMTHRVTNQTSILQNKPSRKTFLDPKPRTTYQHKTLKHNGSVHYSLINYI